MGTREQVFAVRATVLGDEELMEYWNCYVHEADEGWVVVDDQGRKTQNAYESQEALVKALWKVGPTVEDGYLLKLIPQDMSAEIILFRRDPA